LTANRPAQAEILPSTTIDRICALRDAALAQMTAAAASMADAEKAADAANALAKEAYGGDGFHFYDRTRTEEYGRLFTRIDPAKSMEAYRRYVDASVWRHLLNLTGMSTLMDRTARERFDADLAGDVPEVTVDNVRATLEGLLGDAELIFQRGLATAFIGLDRRFKSHDAFQIGARVVLTHVFDAFGMLNWGSRMGETITDIERVFAVLDGHPRDVGSLMTQVQADRGRGTSPRQSMTESTYFRVRTYKNGNAHLWFTRDDLVEKANKVLAAYYGEVLPDAAPGDAEAERDLHSKGGLPSTDLAFYPTPREVVRIAIRELGLDYKPETHRVLEPSAGEGNIAEEIAALGVLVNCVEIDPSRAVRLRRRVPSATVVLANFLLMAPRPIYTHVVMNPPFYGTHWMQHVVHAFDFLAPGGTLVAILPVTAELGSSAKHEAFREWATKRSQYGRLSFRDLPPESFVSSGTRVNTTVLTLHRGN
jgi:hypothetical protein